MTGGRVRDEQVYATREAILTAAERLYAEHGLIAVSNRQISEAAGQGNNAAVGYHFGTKADLIRAVVRRHTNHIEQIRTRMVTEAGDSTELEVWVGCLVRPSTGHLAELGTPTWFARFAAQVMNDPALRDIIIVESLTSPALVQIIDNVNRCLPDLPAEVRADRGNMARHLIVQMTAERELALAEGTPTPHSTWSDATSGLIDALVGLFLAPVTTSQ